MYVCMYVCFASFRSVAVPVLANVDKQTTTTNDER